MPLHLDVCLYLPHLRWRLPCVLVLMAVLLILLVLVNCDILIVVLLVRCKVGVPLLCMRGGALSADVVTLSGLGSSFIFVMASHIFRGWWTPEPRDLHLVHISSRLRREGITSRLHEAASFVQCFH
jgi:hypothetical protein